MNELEFILLQVETKEAAWKAVIEEQAAEYRKLQAEVQRLRAALDECGEIALKGAANSTKFSQHAANYTAIMKIAHYALPPLEQGGGEDE